MVFKILIIRKGGNTMLWNYSLEEIMKGYIQDDLQYQCAICEQSFEKGRIYQEDELLYDALGAVKKHTRTKHQSLASYLLNQELSMTGLTEIQRKLLLLLLEGRSDQDIAKALGVAQSTVRNHRFKIREKEKQAKLFLALMHSLEEETKKSIENSDAGKIEEIHHTARMIDDRYSITDKEREKTIASYMDETGALKQFPAKAKKKIIVLGEIVKNFKRDAEYSEAVVDQVLKRIFAEDYAIIRRSLIEYGFMERSADGSVYRIKE